MRMVVEALLMLANESADEDGIDELVEIGSLATAVSRDGWRAGPQPSRQRNAKAHLGAALNRRWNDVCEGAPQNVLLRRETSAMGVWQRGGVVDQRRSQQRRS